MSLEEAELITDKILRDLSILDVDMTNKEFGRVIAKAGAIAKNVATKCAFANLQLKAVQMGADIPVPAMRIERGKMMKKAS